MEPIECNGDVDAMEHKSTMEQLTAIGVIDRNGAYKSAKEHKSAMEPIECNGA